CSIEIDADCLVIPTINSGCFKDAGDAITVHLELGTKLVDSVAGQVLLDDVRLVVCCQMPAVSTSWWC
ncbi:MAG TPA: hypothetical protein VGC84_06640, partial [Ilumatobacteraceae bacterium]